MLEIPIIYQDEDIIVLNKPASISVHKKSRNDQQETVADFLAQKYPEIKKVGTDPLRPGIVHRLDKYTSGVMIVAHTQKIFEWLTAQFKKREIEKEYTALLVGKLEEKRGTIEAPIGSLGLKKTVRVRTKTKVNNWREARTDWRVVSRYKEYTLVKAYPKTGRTHQLRVHFASLGHAIACDLLYGGRRVPCPGGQDRLFLHASRIRFSLPEGRRLEFEADLPENLTKIIETLK